MLKFNSVLGTVSLIKPANQLIGTVTSINEAVVSDADGYLYNLTGVVILGGYLSAVKTRKVYPCERRDAV